MKRFGWFLSDGRMNAHSICAGTLKVTTKEAVHHYHDTSHHSVQIGYSNPSIMPTSSDCINNRRIHWSTLDTQVLKCGERNVLKMVLSFFFLLPDDSSRRSGAR